MGTGFPSPGEDVLPARLGAALPSPSCPDPMLQSPAPAAVQHCYRSSCIQSITDEASHNTDFYSCPQIYLLSMVRILHGVSPILCKSLPNSLPVAPAGTGLGEVSKSLDFKSISEIEQMKSLSRKLFIHC